MTAGSGLGWRGSSGQPSTIVVARDDAARYARDTESGPLALAPVTDDGGRWRWEKVTDATIQLYGMLSACCSVTATDNQHAARPGRHDRRGCAT